MSEIAEPGQGNPFDALGPEAEARVRELVDRFYDLMDLEPQFQAIRKLHPSTLDGSRDKLFWFLCGWLGGPNHYIERYGHPRLRARHLPFAIGSVERDLWLACMFSAMEQVQLPPEMQQRLQESFFSTADWMRNHTG